MRILPLSNVVFSAVQLDKEITLLEGNIYESEDYDKLAIEFIRKGIKKIPFIPSGGNAKAVIVGFSFEGGPNFYGASDASAGMSKQPLGENEATLLTFNAYARNVRNKHLKKNLKATFPSWDKVNIEYREIPVGTSNSSQDNPKESSDSSRESSPAGVACVQPQASFPFLPSSLAHTIS